ncbi:MAG: sigma factor-like helix-turn-helix DNA-binding protein [Eubacteriales bacterium]
MYEKNLKIGYLLDFYGEILTERKRNILDLYYNQDFSLAEISDEIGISRQGVRELIKKSEDELLFLEDKLGLSQKLKRLEQQADAIIGLAREYNLPQEFSDQVLVLKELINE